ncbi:MAG: YcaO-like family protein [Deltaproteobacteria bacterium]|nr:YcaO-like family protein [Deltaproteobacteria bacterium]MBW2072539.1 YcaO-like family protein [Deltaproteobacteria bacterium]
MDSRGRLHDVFKTYTYDQDKARTPEETVDSVRQKLAELDLDILQKTLRIDTGRLDIPVYISLCGSDALRLIGTKKQMGKGSTAIQAEASALMELVERFSFFSFMKQSNFLTATADETGKDTIAAELLYFSLHDENTDPRTAARILAKIPFRWTPAYNLTTNRELLIPIDWFYTINEYNGPAAGNVREEAILQSICEVVERHVSSIISHERFTTPTIDQASIQDPAARQLLQKFTSKGIQIHLKDFSLDTGIPTVGALAWDPSTFPHSSEIVFTAGTTTSPEKSLIRALTEIAQLAGDFQNRTSYRPTLPKYEDLQEAAYLTTGGPVVGIDALPDLSNANFRIEITRCVDSLAAIGLEVFIVDVTHPELGIPAVYTIIPGAHFLDRARDTDVVFHAAKLSCQHLDGPTAQLTLNRLIQMFPDRYDLRFFLGVTLEYHGLPEEALAQLHKALDLEPHPTDLASIHTHIGVCLKEMKDYAGAIEALEKARDLDPGLKEIYNQLGFCYFKLKEHERSIEQFEKALEIDPGSAIDYANIGSNLREIGHKKEALQLYRMAIELDPTIDFARENIAKLERELAE